MRLQQNRCWLLVTATALLTVLVVHDVPLLHSHGDGGLFSQECPLAQRSAGTCAAIAPVMSITRPGILTRTVVAAGVSAHSVVFVRPFRPRAPPASL
jgi:hypothetical protein